MIFSTFIAISLLSLFALSVPVEEQPAEVETLAVTVPGIDVSHWQPSINWNKVAAAGIKFAYVKATEGTTYRDPKFSEYYTGAYRAGIIHGAYHFAQPSSSSGAAQAKFFLANGGNWSNDGKTLPGMLDLEGTCRGLSASKMVSWIADFSNTYHSKTGRYPTIYTSPSWWKSCTSNSNKFASTNPLMLARWASTPGPLPGGWKKWTIWQYADKGPQPGDQDKFNGNLAALQKFAKSG